MKIGVTGPRGNLGSELVRRGGIPLECDIEDAQSVMRVVGDVDPDVVINCAALMSVDLCEKDPKRAFASNARGVANLRWNFYRPLIHLSTSYVFDGRHGPYTEKCTRYKPLQVYGFSKLAGEAIIQAESSPYTIVRTAGLFGGYKPDFVTFVLDSLSNDMEIDVTTEVYMNPTYIPHLAEALMVLAEMSKPPKIINLTGNQVLNRYEFGRMIAEVFGLDVKLLRQADKVKGWVAGRPGNAGLKTDLAVKLGIPIYDPMQGLIDMKERIGVPV